MTEFKHLIKVVEGCYLENTSKTKYITHRDDEKQEFKLAELLPDGSIKEGAKIRTFPFSIMNGLVRNKYFCTSPIARRISYGQMENDLDFNRCLPK